MTFIYFITIILFFGLITIIVRWRSMQLVKERNLLRKLVDENTREVNEQAKKLEIQAQKLKEMDLVKSNFFANISHEFRTPLSLILGPLKAKYNDLGRQMDPSEIKMMIRNGEKLLKLVNQLLDLSRLEAGNMVLEVRKTDLVKYIKVIADSFNTIAELSSIKFSTSFPNENLMGYLDPGRIEQILYNLLSNAFKFTPSGGEVSLILEFDTINKNTVSTMRFSVVDTGIGIKSENIEKLFDRFYQVDPSDTREHEGSGIGLALTKELVELHGGKIMASNRGASGSRFDVSIPISKDKYLPSLIKKDEFVVDEEEISKKASELIELDDFEDEVVKPEDIEFESLKNATMILLVEDNADVRSFIRNNLGMDFMYKEAANGLDGLAIALETIPDLIITDLMMPKMNGIELSEKIKSDERTSHIPLIMLTAKSDVESKIEGFEKGADHYITKPFDISELQARVANLIEQRNKLREKYSREIKLQPRDIIIKSRDEEFLIRAIETIEKNMSDSEFAVEAFQKEMWMSRMQLHRKLKALTEKSTSEFIRSIKMKRASQLLQSQMGSIAEVAYEVGFHDPSYFTKCFRLEFGVSPSEYYKSS